MQSYENKFNGVAQLFFDQAATARNQLQQNMLLLATNDSIINTAKSVGLDPSAVAANTAMAEQQFQASMQAQGRMAQTFLPLAKAYLTAIVVGLSWLVALLSIIFANYAYIKMFFTLLLWLTLWTPIIAIINYLNDLNLMKVAQVITQGKTALTMGTNMLIYKKIADNASFMNYLVMSTPVLAYAIAKASEQGFVTFASGLSQALQGSSRAAGSFANQQGLSTSSSISSPRGDEVYSMSGGIMSHQSALSAGNGRFGITNIAGGGFSAKDANTGTTVNGDNNGVTSASIAGLSAGDMKSISQSASQEVSKQISDTLKTGQTAQWTANLAFNDSAGHSLDKVSSDTFKAANSYAFEKMAAAGITKASEVNAALMGGGKILGIAGCEVRYANKDGEEFKVSFSEKQMEQWAKDFADGVTSAYNKSESTAASLNKSFSTLQGKEFAQVHSAIDKFNTTESLASSMNADNITMGLNNYIQGNKELSDMWNSGNKAQAAAMAANHFQNMATTAEGRQELAKYLNVGDFNVNNSVGSGPDGQNYYNPSAAQNTHGANTGVVKGAATGYMNMQAENAYTMGQGHTGHTGQNTAYGDHSSDKIKNEANETLDKAKTSPEEKEIGREMSAIEKTLTAPSRTLKWTIGQDYTKIFNSSTQQGGGNSSNVIIPPNPLTGK